MTVDPSAAPLPAPPPPRAFRRQGFFRRTGPLGLATVLGLTLLFTIGPAHDPALLAISVGAVALIWALAWTVPWERLPRWTDVVPPLMLLGILFAVRLRVEVGIPALTLAPLFLVPTFWVALFGTRGDVIIMIAALASVRIGSALVRGDRADLAQGGAAVLVSATICVLTHLVVDRARAAEQALRTIVDRLPVGFAVVRDDKIAYANRQVGRALGRSVADLLGRTVTSLLHPDERAGKEAWVISDAGASPADRRFAHPDGGEVVLETIPMALRFDGAAAFGLVLRDVTDERHLEAAEAIAHERVAHEHAQLDAILSAVTDGVAIIDHERRGIYANPAYLELFGLDERRFVGVSRDAFIRHAGTLAENREEFEARLEQLSADAAVGTFTFVRPRRRVMRRTIRSIDLPGGRGYLVVWHDVTADQDLVAEREQQALTDPLTGLANRRAAELALVRELSRTRRSKTPLSVALLDIDHFKRVNDEHGHDVGDRVLVAVASLLVAQTRITDTIARWGGEEFLAVLAGDIVSAREYCERVRGALRGLSVGSVGRVTLSAGVSVVQPGDPDFRAALRRADEQLYAAKREGRDRVLG